MESSNTRLIQNWLDLQCTMVHGAVRGAVLVANGHTRAADPVAVWPAKTLLSAPLLSAGHVALNEQRQVVESLAIAIGSDISHGCDVIATPVMVDGQSIGVVVMEVTARMKQRQDVALQVLSWGATWLESIIEHLNTGPNLRLSIVIETIADAVKHEEFAAASAAVASALTRLVECTRVSIGFCDAGTVNVVAMSNTARFEKRTNLVRSAGAAMDEAIVQDRPVSLPAATSSSFVLTRAGQQHMLEFGASEIHALPFSNDNEIAGAVLVERQDEQQLNPEDIALLETIVSIVGPILCTKRRAQMPLFNRLKDSGREFAGRFTKPGNTVFKSVALCIIAVALLLIFLPVDYAVKADATLLGRVQRAVIAPYDGYVAEAPMRAGDRVESDAILAHLDDRDLHLERAKWRAEKSQLGKSRQEALAQHDRGKAAILEAQMQQADASLELADEKLKRAKIRSPINGVIVNGDLSQSLGAPVKRGDVLFEVAPVDEYRIVLQVDDRDISHVAIGQGGNLALASLPHEVLPFKVSRIVPTSIAEDGTNYFQVEASLEDTSIELRPGMAGIGKVEVGERSLFWSWTHKLSDRMRLLLWKWLG